MVAINIGAIRDYLERRSPLPKGGGRGYTSSKISSSRTWGNTNSAHRGYYGGSSSSGGGGGGGGGLPPWAIALIVIGVCLVILLIVCYLGSRGKKRRELMREENEALRPNVDSTVGDNYTHADDGYRNDTSVAHSGGYGSSDPDSTVPVHPAPAALGDKITYHTAAPPYSAAVTTQSPN